MICSASSASVPISLISTTSVAPSRVDGRDQLAALEQVVAVARNMVVAAVLVGALLHDREFAILRIVRHPVVERGVLDRDSDHGMRGYVGDLFAAEKYRAAVAQRALVLFSRP